MVLFFWKILDRGKQAVARAALMLRASEMTHAVEATFLNQIAPALDRAASLGIWALRQIRASKQSGDRPRMARKYKRPDRFPVRAPA